MKSTRIALFAALAAVAFWTVKSVAIGVAGGLDKSPLEGPMFFCGLVSFIVAVVSLGVALTAGSRTWLRVVGGIGAVVVGIVFTTVVDELVNGYREPGPDRHWAWTEVNLWVVSLTVLALTSALAARRRGRAPGAAADAAPASVSASARA